MNGERITVNHYKGGYRVQVILFFFLAALFAGATVAEANIYSFTDEEGVVHFSNVPNDGRYKVFLEVDDPRQPKRTRRISQGGSKKYEPLIDAACRYFGVDNDLVRAVIKAESNFNHRAVSRKGAQGLMQLMPVTAQEMSVMDPFDPADNIFGGVQYLKRLLGMFNGDVPLALAAYNAGPERVAQTWQIPKIEETQGYVQKVLTYLRSYKKKYGPGDNKML
ncbi:MAG: lytic transglycosylase domain-containing protein [Pseudomonadota bacterium]